MLHRVFHDGLHVVVAKLDIVVQIDSPVRGVLGARKRNEGKEIVSVLNMLHHGAAIGGIVGIRPLRGHAAQGGKAQHQRSQRERQARPASFSLVRNHCMPPSGQPRTSITFIGASPFCWFAA